MGIIHLRTLGKDVMALPTVKRFFTSISKLSCTMSVQTAKQRNLAAMGTSEKACAPQPLQS